jgi:hypothetical protein
VSPPTDVEISRALNALSMTFGEQRLESFDAARAQAIVSGALAGEHKLDDGRLVATVELRDGRWSVERRLRAGESPWLPQPAAGNRSRPD